MASDQMAVVAAAAPQSSNDDVDERTVFVRSLPFTVTDVQLEDIFSEVGPVRNCFTIKKKGAEQHRGFGFVQFAVKEDASRAVETKNGATLQGRKIKVEIAKRRAPLDQRRPVPKVKDTEGNNEEDGDAEQEATGGIKGQTSENKDDQKRKRRASDDENTHPNVDSLQAEEKDSKRLKHAERSLNPPHSGKQPPAAGLPSMAKKRPREEGKASESQRPARTVIIGCLQNPKMLQSVIAKAKKLGTVEDVRQPLDEVELISRGLAKDGCKQGAAAVVFTSVKVAHQAVAALHKQHFGGGVVWARQLGGEGARLKKWRLIVRNLPFMLKEQTLRELFSPSGFVWEITIPRKPDSSSKGFAFVGFTCKEDAEKAIKAVNGKLVGKRPVAVDWAMAKKEFETATAKTAPPEEAHDDDSTASEDESEDNSEEDDSEDEEATEKVVAKATKKVKVDGRSAKSSGQEQATKKGAHVFENSDDDEDADEEESDSDQSMSDENIRYSLQNIDYSKEQDFVKKVLEKVVNSSKTEENTETQPNSNTGSKGQQPPKAQMVQKKEKTKPKVIDQGVKNVERQGEGPAPAISKEDSMKNTVFVRNLPLDAKVLDMRRQFSAFGEVKSFRLVLHPITKRPKGTAFLEFATVEGAQAAVSAANVTGEDGGMVVGGRKLTLNLALDRDQAKQVAKQMSKEQDDHDRRHLKLAKEGLIEEGTPAAEGVSKADMMKRKQVEHEKATKLRSPNFHVSTTRLAVHNIPKDMNDKELKQLVIKAVKSRASKQQPVVKQVKILRDEVKGVLGSGGKSRGAAFVEFAEHQHALVALRVLNNNPETFGAEHRPIVEFAIENSQILRKRAALAEQAKSRLAREVPARVGEISERKGRKDWRQKAAREKFEKREKVLGESIASEDDKVKDEDRLGKRKWEKKSRKKVNDTTDGGVQPLVNNSEHDGMVAVIGKKQTKKRQKRSEGNAGSVDGPLKKKDKKGESQPVLIKRLKHIRNTNGEDNMASPKPPALSSKVLSNRGEQNRNTPSGRKSPSQAKVLKEETRRDRKKPQAVDKLDQLVAEYRTKYFSAPSTSKEKGDAKTAGDLKRWFE